MTPEAVEKRIARVAASGAALRARSLHAVKEALAETCRRLLDPERAPGRQARAQLPEETGHSLEGVVWALSQALSDAVDGGLDRLAAQLDAPPGQRLVPARLALQVLAGNVFTAPLAPILGALLCRVPTVLRASTRQWVLPQLFSATLGEVDPVLGEACAVLVVPRQSPTLRAALLRTADVLAVFGGDRAVRAWRAEAPATTHVVSHGHGLGVAWVGPDADVDAAADGLALDVAAYDQRGCLSPHAVWVPPGRGRPFAERLAAALEAVAVAIPRGHLPLDVGGAQLQWRGVAEARGGLIEGDGWAVAVEGRAAMRVSPGWRNVQVLEAADEAAFLRAVRPLGVHLKAIGVGGDPAPVLERLPSPLAPRVSGLGAMQRPRLGDPVDGRPALEGYVRHAVLAPR